MRFARDVGRNRKALANAVAARCFKNLSILPRERKHFRQPRPGKSDTGEIACAMHRIGTTQPLIVEPGFPAFRIIVEADGALRSPHVDMMGEREIAKTQILGHTADRLGKFLLSGKAANVPDKNFDPAEHLFLRPRPNAANERSKL